MSEIKGQILPESEFGKALTKYATEADTIVESGTWWGLGSTMCLSNGLFFPEQRMWTMEQDPRVHAEAKSYYDDPRINFICAHTLDIVDRLPSQIDLMLFDADDISTDKEWEVLSPRCTVVALDDTNEMKNRKQRDFLLASQDWLVTHNRPKDRHGWMIARRLNEYDLIYRSGGWDGKGSGPGSTPGFTAKFRDELEFFMVQNNIKSVFDLGCGDFSWQRLVNWVGVSYQGWDLSFFAINFANSVQTFPSDSMWSLNVGDPTLRQHRVKPTDLLIVKDVIHHATFEERLRIIEFSKRFKWVLWVVDMENETRPCYWPLPEVPKWELFYKFDLSIENYHYGLKFAWIERNTI